MGIITNFTNSGIHPFHRKYEEVLIDSETKKIDNTNYVLKETKKINSDLVVDITLFLTNQKYFIGRYPMFQERIAFDVSNEYIIVYTWNFDSEQGKVVINKILSLYNINDKVEVVGTFKELGDKFNNSVKKQLSFEENNDDKLIYRSDIERKRKAH